MTRIGRLLVALAGAAAALLVIPTAATADVPLCAGQEATIVASGENPIEGTAGDDVIVGSPGEDVIYGRGGDDIICGGRGGDTIYGGGGSDLILGKAGKDYIRGGSGNDELRGGAGNDRLWGKSGVDTLIGGKGNDVLRGGAGDDIVKGDSDVTAIESAGSDTIRGGGGTDRLFALADYADGDGSGDIRGGSGFDICSGGAGQDCEWDGVSVGPEIWRPLVAEVFSRWGLATQECSTEGGPEHCVGPQVDNAVAVLTCESGGDAWAVNNSSLTSGLFQHQRGVFWSERVDRVIAKHADKEPGFPADASWFDPEHNVIIAALLVWESKETQLHGDVTYGSLGGVSPEIYPEFNFNTYSDFGYGYSNWGEGPEPWGHWVGCASTGAPYNGLGLYDAAWIHPWAEEQWD